MRDNIHVANGQGNHGARTLLRGKYAKARIAAGLRYSDMRRLLGCSYATVSNADRGQLPKHRAIRAEYLRTIGITEKSDKRREGAA